MARMSLTTHPRDQALSAVAVADYREVHAVRQKIIGIVLGGLLIGSTSLILAGGMDPNKVLDGFVASIEKPSSATAEQKRAVVRLIEQLRQTPEDRAADIT